MKYNVKDSSNNVAAEVVILLTSTDDTPPVISGSNNTVKTENAPQWEPTFTVIDNFDQDITESTIIEYYEIGSFYTLYICFFNRSFAFCNEP